MKRKFITNLALLLFLNLLIKPIYAFGIDVGVQNAVGARDYGNYFILTQGANHFGHGGIFINNGAPETAPESINPAINYSIFKFPGDNGDSRNAAPESPKVVFKYAPETRESDD